MADQKKVVKLLLKIKLAAFKKLCKGGKLKRPETETR